MYMPENIPAIKPIINGVFLSDFTYSPKNTAGNIWTISIPPSSCSDMAYVAGTENTNARAINLNTVDDIFVILISELFERFGFISLMIFLVKRFACAIAMIAAGTRPPTKIPSNAIPENHPGREYRISDGTTNIPRELSGNPDKKCIAPGTA